MFFTLRAIQHWIERVWNLPAFERGKLPLDKFLRALMLDLFWAWSCIKHLQRSLFPMSSSESVNPKLWGIFSLTPKWTLCISRLALVFWGLDGLRGLIVCFSNIITVGAALDITQPDYLWVSVVCGMKGIFTGMDFHGTWSDWNFICYSCTCYFSLFSEA